MPHVLGIPVDERTYSKYKQLQKKKKQIQLQYVKYTKRCRTIRDRIRKRLCYERAREAYRDKMIKQLKEEISFYNDLMEYAPLLKRKPVRRKLVSLFRMLAQIRR